MTKKLHIAFSISALVVALAVPLMAQSFRMTANIPFEFTVGNKTLPAGAYEVRRDSSPSLLLIQGRDHGAGALSLATRQEMPISRNPESHTNLVFNHYGNRYFLAEVNDGFDGTGFVMPTSHTERELSKTASAQRYEVLATLARR
jgi:hypothetical protein